MKIRAMGKKIRAIILVTIIAGGAAAGYFYFYYVPPPTVQTTLSSCEQFGLLASNTTVSSVKFLLVGTLWRLDVAPAVAQFTLGNLCLYNDTTVTVPIRCGTMCGGGVGDIIEKVKQLKVNFSFTWSANDSVSNYTLSLSTAGAGNFSTIFYSDLSAYMNSQQVSSDASPLCYNDFGEYQTDCSSITVQFPASPGSYSFLVNSSEELVP